MALPIVIPEICMGVAMLAFFARVGWPAELPWPLNLSAITIAHVSFSFPFVAVVVRARLQGFNRELAEAAQDLGASEWRVFRDVMVPFMRPGLIAGGMLAFTLSLDDFVITFFTSGPNNVTFPVTGIGRAPCRERGGQYVLIRVGAGAFKKTKHDKNVNK